MDWESMKSARKDGTRILLFWRDFDADGSVLRKTVRIGHYLQNRDKWAVEDWPDSAPKELPANWPEKWQLLPPPPEGAP